MVLGEAPGPALPSGAPGSRCHGRRWSAGRSRWSPTSGSTCSRPAGGSPTARHRPPPGPVAARAGPRRSSRSRPRTSAAPSRSRSPGPWTLAASVEKPRGDKVLADHGARRELAQALAEGVGDHLADVRRRVAGRADRRPGRRAGPGRPCWPVGPDRVGLRPAPGGAPARGVRGPGVGARGRRDGARGSTRCAAGAPWQLLRGAGARGLSADLSVLDRRRHGRARRGARGRGDARARRRTVARARDRPRREDRSPSGCCAGSTCSGSTPRPSPSGW